VTAYANTAAGHCAGMLCSGQTGLHTALVMLHCGTVPGVQGITVLAAVRAVFVLQVPMLVAMHAVATYHQLCKPARTAT
jgi:hypothetical protein